MWSNLRADMNAMTVLVQGMKHDVGKLVPNVFKQVNEKYVETVEALKLRILKDFFGWWKKSETHFQVA